MDRTTADVSSDEDDPYTNFVGRLKVLKEQRFKKSRFAAEIETDFSNDFKQHKNGEEENDKDINDRKTNGKKTCDDDDNENNDDNDDTQINMRMVRSRRNKGINTRATVRQTRRRHRPVDNLEYDSEIVSSEENSELISKNQFLCNNDTEVILSAESPESISKNQFSCNNDIIALLDDDEIKDDNYEINIKVCWRSRRIDRLSMRRHDNFQGIFQHYADLENVSVNEILIMKKDKIVNCTDTPASLKLSIIDILDGGIVHPGMKMSEDKNNDDDDDSNTCIIKIQTANKKQSLTISLKKDQRFNTLFAKCAEQLGVKESSLKLYFDGEQIGPTDTPESLDLEGEACVDLHIST